MIPCERSAFSEYNDALIFLEFVLSLLYKALDERGLDRCVRKHKVRNIIFYPTPYVPLEPFLNNTQRQMRVLWVNLIDI